MVFALIGKWLFSCYASCRLRRARKRLDRIKINNYRRSRGLPPVYTGCQKISRWFGKCLRPCKNAIRKIFCPCCVDYKSVPEGKRTCYDKLWINGTKQNRILKTIAGFAVGVMLSFLLWNTAHADPISFTRGKSGGGRLGLINIFREQRETSMVVKIFLVLTGIFITSMLTFSEASRCVFVLSTMQFFKNEGRAALLGYTLILALSGPAKNTTTNMEILTNSLACGQELLKKSILDLFSFVKDPFTSFQKAIGAVIDSLQMLFERMKTELEAVVDTVQEIISVIRSVYDKLKNIMDLCNYEFGTPYERCMESFESASENCKVELGDTLDWMCYSVDTFDFVCGLAKATDVIVCFFPSLVREHVFDPVVQHFKDFANEFRKFFDARLNITYKLDHSLSRDKTFAQVFEGVKKDILSRCEWLFQYINLMDVTLLFPFFYVLYKGLSYRRRYLKSDRYDNYYLSNSLIKMDIRRVGVGGQSIFPLRHREFNLYVETFSWRMIKEERRHRRLAIILVALASIQILSYLLIDYALYKFMEWIRINSAVDYKKWNDPLLGMTATVEGSGFLAAMYRSILENLNPLKFVLPSLDTRECLPVAIKPNYRTYFWIFFLLSLCFLLAMFEPYGLRLRHIICGWVYPRRVRERERWLYVHIQTTRGSFLEFAKNTVRSKVGFKKRRKSGGKGKTMKKRFHVSCLERLVHKIPILRKFIDPTGIKCFVCGTRGQHDDRESFIDCMECGTVYCKECMADMNGQCVICSKTIDSGMSSGTDTEDDFEVYRDSDEDEDKPLLSRGGGQSPRRKRRGRSSRRNRRGRSPSRNRRGKSSSRNRRGRR